MSAVWMRLRSEMRARWRSWLGLALLIGIAGGAAVAAAVGARRTETAYPRFVQAQKGYDLVTGGFPGNIDAERALAEMAAMPEVLEWARVDVAASAAILPSGRRVSIPELAAVTDLSGRAGFQLNRFRSSRAVWRTFAHPTRRWSTSLPPTVKTWRWEARFSSSSVTQTPCLRDWPLFASLGLWPRRPVPGCRCFVGLRWRLRNPGVR
jgi:hypothetical protein